MDLFLLAYDINLGQERNTLFFKDPNKTCDMCHCPWISDLLTVEWINASLFIAKKYVFF